MTSDATRPKRRYAKLTPEQWAEAEALWTAGGTTLPELAATFGITERGLQARFASRGLVKGSAARARAAEAGARITDTALPDADLLAKRVKAVRESRYLDATAIQQAVMDQLAVIQSDPAALASVSAAIRTLNLAAMTVRETVRIRSEAVGLDKHNSTDGVLPVLPIRPMTMEEVQAIRDKQEQEDRALALAAAAEEDDDEDIVEMTDDEPEKGEVLEKQDPRRPPSALNRSRSWTTHFG